MAQVKEHKSFINLGIVNNSKREILMIKRRIVEKGNEDKISSAWVFPGGKQRADETKGECVTREILEETGYEVASIKELNLRPHQEYNLYTIYHLCKPVQSVSDNVVSEATEVKWVPFDEIRTYLTEELDSTVSTILEME